MKYYSRVFTGFILSAYISKGGSSNALSKNNIVIKNISQPLFKRPLMWMDLNKQNFIVASPK